MLPPGFIRSIVRLRRNASTNPAKPSFCLRIKPITASREPLAASEFYPLGLGEPIPVSAINGRGIGDLLDDILKKFPPPDVVSPDAEAPMKLAIVGKPNVGKSSYLNSLLGYDRAIVTPIAGTTRDTLHTEYSYYGQKIILIDTAGLRRKKYVAMRWNYIPPSAR